MDTNDKVKYSPNLLVSMTATHTECGDCGTRLMEEPNFCPECGAEEPAVETETYSIDEDSLPTVIESSVYRDNWELWYEFTEQLFGHRVESGEANVESVDPRDFKYSVFEVYWAVDTSGEIHGPFQSVGDAREEIA